MGFLIYYYISKRRYLDELPYSLCKEVHEISKSFMWHSLSSTQHTVVSPFHERLLQLHCMFNAWVLQGSGGKKFKFSMEFSNSILHKKPQKVETQDWILLRGWGKAVTAPKEPNFYETKLYPKVQTQSYRQINSMWQFW